VGGVHRPPMQFYVRERKKNMEANMSFSNQKKSKVDWFPVSVNVFDDIKISMLRLKYGNNGFVFYTVMVTEIYRSGTYSLKDT
jgi:hypothetical protein